MIPALLTAGALLLIAGAAVAGLLIGHRRGVTAGRADMVRRLVLTKNPEVWEAAHYLEVDLAQEADTARHVRRRTSAQLPAVKAKP